MSLPPWAQLRAHRLFRRHAYVTMMLLYCVSLLLLLAALIIENHLVGVYGSTSFALGALVEAREWQHIATLSALSSFMKERALNELLVRDRERKS